MTCYLVQATMHARQYTHYTCRTKEAADRLALVLAEKRPNLLPVEVVPWAPTPEQLARVCRWADESTGPR